MGGVDHKFLTKVPTTLSILAAFKVARCTFDKRRTASVLMETRLFQSGARATAVLKLLLIHCAEKIHT